MASKFCHGDHETGKPFAESGNVYCKKCGEFLYCFNDIEKAYIYVMEGHAKPAVLWFDGEWFVDQKSSDA